MDLISAMQAEYSRCKRLLYWWAVPIGIGLLVAALAGAFELPGGLGNTLAVLVFIGQIAIFVLRQLACQHQGMAEDVRRMAMLQDGLGVSPSPMTLADLWDRIGDCRHSEPPYIGSYYDSSEPPGPRRLLDICAECAFFTGGNARRMAKILTAVAIGGVASVLVGFVAIVMAVDSVTTLHALARTVLVLVAFFTCAEFTSMALSFWSLAAIMKHLGKECEQALNSGSTENLQTAALALFADYNCAVAKTPPIPACLYSRYQERMNQAWQDRHAAPLMGPASNDPDSTSV